MLRPLGDRIIIELVEVEEKTAFGIVLPDSAKEKPQTGKVVAVGTGRVLDNGTRVEIRKEILKDPKLGTKKIAEIVKKTLGKCSNNKVLSVKKAMKEANEI